ncbi:hypothetical protein AB3X52_00125 [Nocardioides sp. DS6]|uniref:Uncharacterized protein n=1 Tax=Nocardioides eburneus TaxID=3231482 RepID=A0ABV3SSU7_9ACTN
MGESTTVDGGTMKAGDWTEAHSALMEAAATDAAADEVDLDATWDQVARRIDNAPRGRGRRRAVAIVAASAVLAGGGTAAAAATGVFSAHTGRYASGHDIKQGGPGEFLKPKGEDFPTVVLKGTADIPFPSEKARSISAQFQIDDLKGPGVVTTGALRGFVANDAICSWSNAWAAAVADGDDAAAKAAADELRRAGTWPAVRALDTELVMRTTIVHFKDGSPPQKADDSSRFGFLRLVQKDINAGDVDALGSALAENVFCIPALMPDLPQAVPTP